MSEKTCSHHEDKRRKFFRRLFAGIIIVGFIILVTFLIIWAVLQPKKPRFILQDVTVYTFNVSAPNLLTSNIQITIASRNPNDRIGIYYDQFDVYAIYRGQQITYYTLIDGVYQGHNDVNVWSPFISGTNVPIAPYNGVGLSQDQASGAVWLMVKIDGRVRWRVGSVITGRYHLHVTCPAYLTFGSPNTGVFVGNGVKYQLSQSCRVSV